MEQLKIELITEDTLINTDKIYNTYYLQMLLKLLIARNIIDEYYVTLDADIYFCKKCNSSNFFSSKAYYEKIKIVNNMKGKWVQRVEKIFDVTIEHHTNQTPFVFNTIAVKNMLDDIDVNNLILVKNCSEYTLFYGYLLKNNLLDKYYTNYKFTGKAISYNTNKNITIDNEVLLSENFLLNENNVIACIQSRANQHYKLLDILKQHIPSIDFKIPKIALLTVVSNDEYYEMYKDAFYTKFNYCKYHNYDFCFDIIDDSRYKKNKGWMKIYKLKEIIRNYDYVMMSDADVIITNRDIRINDIINEYNMVNKICLITTDYNSINSGNVIWKNCPETIRFIDLMLSHNNNYTNNSPYKSMGIYEQPCIIDIINRDKDYRDMMMIIPQFKINSYPKFLGEKINNNIVKSINGITNRSMWKNGDFLIHFTGVNYNNTLWDKMDIKKEVKKYVLIYKVNIIKKEGNDYGLIY